MITKKFLALTISVFFILLYSCDKKRNQDPVSLCKSNLQDTSFRIGEFVGLPGSERFYEADTIVASRNAVRLLANDSLADEYTWHFSTSSQLFSGRSVSVVFDQPIGAVQIILTIKRNPNNPCVGRFPAQAEYRKTVVIVDANSSPLLGTYSGYNMSDKSKTFSVQVLSNGIKNIPLPTTGNYWMQNEIIYGSSAFFMAGAGTYDPPYGAYATEGFGYLIKPKTIEIDYQYKKPVGSSDYTVMKDTFYGIKQ